MFYFTLQRYYRNVIHLNFCTTFFVYLIFYLKEDKGTPSQGTATTTNGSEGAALHPSRHPSPPTHHADPSSQPHPQTTHQAHTDEIRADHLAPSHSSAYCVNSELRGVHLGSRVRWVNLGWIIAVLLTLPMQYYSYRQWSTTSIAHAVLLLFFTLLILQGRWRRRTDVHHPQISDWHSSLHIIYNIHPYSLRKQ